MGAPPAPAGPVDPYNCAVGQYFSWDGAKQQWCCRIHHVCGQPTQAPAPADPYIAKMVSRIGRLAGVSPKKNGAVGCMARVARIRAVVASAVPSAHPASHTIATLDLPTGWQAGASPRRLGAVRTRARAAHQQLEDVLE